MIETLQRISQRGHRGRLAVNLLILAAIGSLIYVGIDNYFQGETIQRIVTESNCEEARTSTDLEARRACDQTRADADRNQPLAHACIQIKRTFTRDAVRRFTVCGMTVDREGVVRQQGSSNPSQLSGPPEGGTVAPNRPIAPPGNPPDSSNPPSVPSPSDPPSAPPAAPSPPVDPPAVVPPARPSRPSINVTAPGVDVSVGDNGVCAGVAGVNVGLGNC